MNRSLFKAFSALTILALMMMALPMQGAQALSTTIVISQVYGGGGNTGAPYTNDFIELFNKGTSTVSVAGWSVQYTSAAGTANFGSATNLITPLSGSLAPGQYLLVQEAGGTTGSPLPTPDVTDSTPINMAAGGGKVALVNTTTPLGCNGGSTPCSPAALATIVDLIGWDGSNFFEGSGPGPTTTNTTAAFRASSGCLDTDNNASDFTAGAPAPRNTASALHICSVDLAINDISLNEGNSGTTTFAFNVSLTLPAGPGGVTFDIGSADNTATSPSDFTAKLLTGQTIPAGSSTYTFDVLVNGDTTTEPDETFFVNVTNVTGATVTDGQGQGTIQNDDVPPTFIHDIQGASHISPMNGVLVTNVNGIVTAKRSNGFYMQDPNPDSNDATSEGVFVFTSSAPTVNIGDAVRVNGTVQEFRPGGASTGNLTTTEISNPGRTVTILSSGNPLPSPTVIGTGGRMPPTANIEDDAAGDVETSGIFDPATDGIDFYESMEAMLVQVNNPVAVGPTNAFGETPVVPDNGSWAGVRTPRGGILLQSNDGNPERLVLDDVLVPIPAMNVGDHLNGAVVGALDYNFGNFFLEVTTNPLPPLVSGGLTQESTTATGTNELAVATFNVENLAPSDSPLKFSRLANLIVNNLKAPDVIAIEEIQDNSGATDNGIVDASTTWTTLISAIQSAGGPTYDYRQIDPVNDQDGGQPGGNIRQGFLFRTDRGLNFIDRPGGNSTTANAVTGSGAGTQLQYSPGRLDPTNAAFNSSRKPLAGEFMFNGHHLFVIANHFNSKGGDDPLFGHFQPPTRISELQRHQQAQVVHDFVNNLVTADPNADVVVLGDLNDFEFSDTVSILKGTPAILNDLMDTLPQDQRYSYVFEGNSQTLDQTLFSNDLFNTRPFDYDVVHVNSEFADQASDHEPQVTRIKLNDPPTADAGGPYSVNEGGSVSVSATGSDPENGPLTYAWDLDNNGSFETSGQSATFSAATLDGPASYIIKVQVTDNGNVSTVDEATVNVSNVAPTVNTPSVSPEPSIKGAAVTGSATFNDPAPNDAPFTCTVDYGDGSGVLTGMVSGSTCTGPSHTYANVGSYTMTVSVTDKDDGTGSNSISHAVVYNFTGFFQPVDNLPTVNTVKAGQAIPVKFSLNGNQGLNIFAAGYPKIQFTSCTNGTEDTIETTVIAGNSSLSYDPTTDQYTYVWKTDKAWASKCGTLQVMFDDGTTQTALFKFTK